MRRVDVDVIVVGTGIAGTTAAPAASERGAEGDRPRQGCSRTERAVQRGCR